jgi:hypothetical protein
LVKNAPHIKPRLKRDLKFMASTEHLSDDEWQSSEMIPIFDKSKNHGILLIDFDDGEKTVLPFDLSARKPNQTGRITSIICDFCRTWRPGAESALITFPKNAASITFLCCGDLKCSLNARNKTDAARKSHTQLREDISLENKIRRLQDKLRDVAQAILR